MMRISPRPRKNPQSDSSLAGIPRRQEGMILLIVLTCLALLAILIVSFMSGASTELAASRQYAASAETQNLASSALNLAMGQVAAGTKADRVDVSWASQPGMIRNYNTTSTNSVALFKLYSSANMTITGTDAATFPAGSDLDAAWDTKPVIYTDLNAPLLAGSDLVFPIVDPRASAGPRAVEGFSYTASISGVTPAVSGDDASARLPMPVQWLYVLKDGRFVAASSTNGTVAEVTGATASNPIVGRVAFWTDDESSKVNVNTASEGVFWDVPFVSSPEDYRLDRFPPVQGEFQRFPGHPAGVSLSAVFPWLKGSVAGSTATAIYDITPRIRQGGSLEGTRNPGQLNSTSFTQIQSTMVIPPDADRLYDSVDELIFNPQRGMSLNATQEDLEKRRFFLTAHSRSPELTLSNTPKVAIWPIATDPKRRSPAENLIIQAASSGPPGSQREFFFTRSDPLSATVDYADSGRSGRNQELIDYLSFLARNPIPGFGPTTFASASRWGADLSQILLQVFDYIRGTVNLRNPTNPARLPFTGQNTSGSSFNSAFVYPTVLANGQRGFGRHVTVSEVAMLFGCEKDGSTVPPSPTSTIWPALIVEMMLTSPGSKLLSPNVALTISGLGSMKWSYNKPGVGVVTERMWPEGTTKRLYAKTGPFNVTAGHGYQAAYYPASFLYTPENTRFTPFVSDNMQGAPVDNANPTFDFLGGTVEIFVRHADDPASPPQVFEITFPPILGLPNPKFVPPNGSNNLNTLSARVAPGGTFTANNFIQQADVVKSLQVRHGDMRLTAVKSRVTGGLDPEDDFIPHPSYSDPRITHSHLLRLWTPLYAGPRIPGNFGFYDPMLTNYREFSGNLGYRPKISSANPKAANSLDRVGDWDTGMGCLPDGPFINKPDEGGDVWQINNNPSLPWTMASYLDSTQNNPQTTELYFAPSRQMASAVMFGSLPTGVMRNRPWETLLFCPNPAAGFGASDHPGFGSPPDYLFLDFFWMPVTEPYALSDRFSTAGKINLNYQIQPFNYINRSTSLHALLKSEKVSAIPNNGIQNYKVWYPNTNPPALQTRFDINIPETLKQFRSRFDSGTIFKSASEICSVFLVPSGQTEASIPTFWANHRLTGDNMRERPYNAIYPRVTTQSNVYTVYVKAQSLKQLPGTLATAANTFTEGRDLVEGEFRASYTFERYIDPNAENTKNDEAPLGSFYKLRVINQRNLSF